MFGFSPTVVGSHRRPISDCPIAMPPAVVRDLAKTAHPLLSGGSWLRVGLQKARKKACSEIYKSLRRPRRRKPISSVSASIWVGNGNLKRRRSSRSRHLDDMEEGYTRLPASHLPGSVPAVIAEDRITSASNQAFPGNFGTFPRSAGGYQDLGSPTIADEQTTTSWRGVFSISSYRPYFNIDSDAVVDRIISSVYPMNDFYRKIDYNPDLYGPIWISATLIVILAILGNVGTYLMRKGSDPSTTWMFDVSYIDWAACIIFGYAIAVPALFYFLFYYFGSATSLLRLWCMWGYSLFIFLPTCLLLVVPLESFRWIITLLAGTASSWFIAVNLKAHAQASDTMTLVISAMALQFALALFIKIFFFA